MWHRLLMAFLAFLLSLSVSSPSQTQERFFAEDEAADVSLLPDSTEVQSEDLSEILANLIRPLISMVSAYVPAGEDELKVTRGLRVIIFSPHPDDESLAAGGLMHRVVSQGGEVRVVFVTNGDGYPEAVRRQLGHPARSSQDFIEYGMRRHDEALQALCELGVPPEDAIFLGFPDDGIDDLLKDHWSKLTPYTSPHTQFSRARYKTVSGVGRFTRELTSRIRWLRSWKIFLPTGSSCLIPETTILTTVQPVSLSWKPSAN